MALKSYCHEAEEKMKNKKALLFGFLALLVFLTLPGCDGNTNSPAETEDTYNETALETSVPDDYTSDPSDLESNNEGFFFSAGLDENGFWQGIRALDYVDNFNYQAISIPAEVHQVSEQEVQEIIENMLFGHISREQITDRRVADGDTINIDFVGSVDGEEFAGGSTFEMGTYVTLGTTMFIDDFLDQLIGHMPGTVVNVEVTFPDEYHEPSLEGMDAVFVTTINYISGDEIRPELTDDFVAENLAHFQGVTTVDELFENIQSLLQSNAVQIYIHDYITTQVVIKSIPEQLIVYFEQLLLQQHVEQAMQLGMELEDILAMHGFENAEDFIEHNQEAIETEARLSLILQAVAEDAGITANIQDVTDFFIENFGSEDFSEFEEAYGLPWLKQFIREQMIMDYISEQAILL